LSSCELLKKYLNFSFNKPCRFWVSGEDKADRCMLDYSVPVCGGYWCEEIGEGMYITVCDKLKEIARKLPLMIHTGVERLDLILGGGFSPSTHVALLGSSEGVELIVKNSILSGLEKGYMCIQMVLGEPRVRVNVKNAFLLEDLSEFYESTLDGYYQVKQVSKFQEKALERSFSGLLIVFDASTYLKNRPHSKKPFIFEERIRKIKLKETVILCMYDGGVIGKVDRPFILDTHDVVLEARDEPLAARILKAARISDEWIRIPL